jgi:hypothetical protein
MKTFVGFGVGLGNLGRFGPPRILAASWIAQLNGRLSTANARSVVVGTYGHTGNFVVNSSGPINEVANELTAAVAPCAVLEIEELQAIVEGLRDLRLEAAPPAVRYTPGAALLVAGTPRPGMPGVSSRATYVTRLGSAVLLAKNDRITRADTLDRNNRMGGWGAVSAEVGQALGGRWTARSNRTLSGVLSKVLRMGD